MRHIGPLNELRCFSWKAAFHADGLLQILQDLDEHRFMHTGQFQRLYGQRAKRDLQHLTEQGMIGTASTKWAGSALGRQSRWNFVKHEGENSMSFTDKFVAGFSPHAP